MFFKCTFNLPKISWTHYTKFVYSWIRASQYDSVEITNKMQPCNRIYYFTVHWRLNMFWAAYRSSSWALTVFAACGDRPYSSLGTGQFPLWLDYGRSPHTYVNQRLQIHLEILTMSGVPLETCWAFNERWNNKLYYKVASCWLFLLRHYSEYFELFHEDGRTAWRC
jgi:hypothetical protein